MSYPKLDSQIEAEYAANSKATLSKGLYDSYIRAIRWASDRIGDAGVIGFVTGSGYVEKPAMDGLRRCLVNEFSSIYVLNLRGDIRKNMLSKGKAQEGQNIFGAGSMTGIAITLFVKNPNCAEYGKIYYHDIGNDLSTVDKLSRIAQLGSIGGISEGGGWVAITPDDHGDWLAQRDKSFEYFLVLGNKKSQEKKLFANYSLGLSSNRDAWVYNYSKKDIQRNMSAMIDFYNAELHRLNVAYPHADRKAREAAVDSFINTDKGRISWTRALKGDLAKGKSFSLDEECLTPSLYRPFTRQYLYYSRSFNEMVLQMPRIFPMKDSTVKNQVICVSGVGTRSGFSSLMTDALPSLDTVEKGQCFPRYLYAEDESALDERSQGEILGGVATGNIKRRDAITDEGLAHFQAAYLSESITKDDLFYYVYGILHSEDYRTRFADNLSKELPRIPAVKNVADFWAFVEAGRKLGDLHCDYETVEPYPVVFSRGDTSLAAPADPVSFYRVEKMKFAGKRQNLDKTTVIYNSKITITGIPLDAYEYVVNGKPALEWVMERQCVKTDRASGIVNDANCYAIETAGDPAYPLKLFQRVITVSLETMKIVKGLPSLGELS